MKKISVKLDDATYNALMETRDKNSCTISDVVNAAILAFSRDKQPVMIIDKSAWESFRDTHGKDFISKWCECRSIDQARLRYIINRTARGGAVCGFGNIRNKARDAEDGRIYKTHTAWIAQCLIDDFGMDITK
jgi:hypothetical protein